MFNSNPGHSLTFFGILQEPFTAIAESALVEAQRGSGFRFTGVRVAQGFRGAGLRFSRVVRAQGCWNSGCRT